jgi:hypothetical protein
MFLGCLTWTGGCLLGGWANQPNIDVPSVISSIASWKILYMMFPCKCSFKCTRDFPLPCLILKRNQHWKISKEHDARCCRRNGSHGSESCEFPPTILNSTARTRGQEATNYLYKQFTIDSWIMLNLYLPICQWIFSSYKDSSKFLAIDPNPNWIIYTRYTPAFEHEQNPNS